ncbi:CPBP family intramembrane glutamic endopeptidase [Tessaracoccus sp. G1721]
MTTTKGLIAPAHLVAVAWVVVLGASLLPRVVVQEVLRRDFTDDARLLVSASVIATALVATAVWARLRPLVPFLVALAVLVGAEALVYRVIDQAPAYRAWLADPSFPVYMLAEQSLRLMVTALMIAALMVLRRRPSRFFLTVGDLHAPMRRIPWLGVKDGTRWSRFGPLAAAGLSAGTLTFVLLAGAPAPDVLARALPLVPVILLAATLNAFSDEVAWKASLLSVLEGPVGPRQAVLMVAAYFGMGHYYGIPYGVIGVSMAFALGWLLARSMVETRGLFWAWFIHFCQDVIIFSFLAIGSITPGGA